MEFVSSSSSGSAAWRATIAFKPGLNVLYGSNEVGKSSIARAVRFALLLAAASNAAEAWVPWSGGGDPIVTLIFRTTATDYYRVKKIFGTSTALLEKSSDGVAWSSLARGRDVEGRLRALLQWGIPEPGGPRAPKDSPSFSRVRCSPTGCGHGHLRPGARSRRRGLRARGSVPRSGDAQIRVRRARCRPGPRRRGVHQVAGASAAPGPVPPDDRLVTARQPP
jgi:hypothetical protein